MQAIQGSLMFIGVNTPTPQVFWNGEEVPNVTGIRIDWESDEQRVKLKVSAELPIHAELRLAGLIVKLENRHE